MKTLIILSIPFVLLACTNDREEETQAEASAPLHIPRVPPSATPPSNNYEVEVPTIPIPPIPTIPTDPAVPPFPIPEFVSCVARSTYCGGPESKVGGEVGTLYRCNADGFGATKLEVCAAGCQISPGANDNCRRDQTCVPHSTYCGGPTSKVKGELGTLYRCDADGRGATEVAVCSKGCEVNPGANDNCH